MAIAAAAVCSALRATTTATRAAAAGRSFRRRRPSTSPAASSYRWIQTAGDDDDGRRSTPNDDGRDDRGGGGGGGGAWSSFARDWNSSLSRRPQEVVATFLAAQSTAWLGLYAGLSSSPHLALFFPPELAAGWMVARLTRKFRQPANVALAAGLVRAFPAVTEIKVSPLVTGFAADASARREMAAARERVERSAPAVGTAVDALSRGARWLEGPVDTYGLAFYLSGKASSLATMWASSVLIREGVDVQGMLAEWGISEGVGDAAGTIAGAATINALLTPLHFLAVVYGVRGIEEAARRIARNPEWLEGYRKHKAMLEEAEKRGTAGRRRRKRRRRANKDGGSGEAEREYIEHSSIKLIGMLLLFYSLGVSLYAIRLMKETAEKKKDEEGITEDVASEGQREAQLPKQQQLEQTSA